MMTMEAVPLTAVVARDRPPLSGVLARPGTRAVLLAGSRDPNAKVTLVLLDGYGAAFVVKVPTTAEAARVVQDEAELLEAVRRLPIGRLATTVPQPLGYLDADGLPALLTNALAGTPMSVRYHAWRHTARRRRVHADFAAAAGWRTVVHGDYWYGNLLVARERRAVRVVGVVDWESCALSGEPLRDVARFAVSYALYLDRHVRPGHRVPGHRGLRADSWGAGLVHAARGRGWFGALVRRYLGAAAERLGISGDLWPEIMLAGIADVAATADHPDFARHHLDLLMRLTGPDGGAG